MYRSISQIHNIHVSGNGRQPMLFAHGLGCDQSIWRYVSPAFEAQYQVVLFDYIGSGQSDFSYYDNQRHGTLHGYAQDILNICKELDLKELIFVGHSVSSMIGMLAAIENPAIFSDIIMIAPTPCLLNDGHYKGGFERAELDEILSLMEKNYAQWASYLGAAIINDDDRVDLQEEMKDRFCLADHEITKKFTRVSFFSDQRPMLPKMVTRTLIMQCAEDLLAPLAVGAYLRSEIANSEFRAMKARGHCPHLSAPGETIRVISRYLESRAASE